MVPLGGREILALEILQLLDVGPRRDNGAPEVEQVEEIRHLDAARIGKTDRQQRRAAADLEFAGIELRRIGIRRAFFELDGEPILLIEFLRLDHRRQKAPSDGAPNTTMEIGSGACGI